MSSVYVKYKCMTLFHENYGQNPAKKTGMTFREQEIVENLFQGMNCKLRYSRDEKKMGNFCFS